MPDTLMPLTSRWLVLSIAVLVWTSAVRHTEVPGINMLGLTPGLVVADLAWRLILKIARRGAPADGGGGDDVAAG
jgi:hypothetical protein